jgi:type IV pilus assembly protein PilV
MSMMKRPVLHPRRSRGMSLVEVMFTVVLVSIGLIGLVGLQARAMQYAMSAEDTTRAALLADELAAAMWTSSSLTVDEDVLKAWQDRVANPTQGGLLNGVGAVSVAGAEATITITWRPPSRPVGGEHRYQTQVLVP